MGTYTKGLGSCRDIAKELGAKWFVLGSSIEIFVRTLGLMELDWGSAAMDHIAQICRGTISGVGSISYWSIWPVLKGCAGGIGKICERKY